MISIAAFKDNTLIEDPTGALSNGGDLGIFAGRVGATGLTRIRRALVAFDLSAIPSGSTITNVELRLRLAQARMESGSRTMTVHKLLGDWGEGTADDLTLGGGGGAVARPGDATWLDQFNGSDPWTAPGGDFVSLPSASLAIPPLLGRYYTFTSTPELVADVQSWVTSPQTNFGWMIRGDESVAQTARRFFSRDNTVVGDRPTVIIEYSPSTPRLPGDVDRDGDVDGADLAKMTDHWGQMSSATADEGDFTDDGKVGLADLAMLQSRFFQTPMPVAAHPSVPEPAAWTIAFPLTLALVYCGRRILSPTVRCSSRQGQNSPRTNRDRPSPSTFAA
jgi:hypothetical protein